MTSLSMIKSTILEINSTQMTTEDCQKRLSGRHDINTNKVLLILIKTFGCVDILLICIHIILFANDRRKKTQVIGVENRYFTVGNISIYEDIDIVSL